MKNRNIFRLLAAFSAILAATGGIAGAQNSISISKDAVKGNTIP